MIIRTEKQIQSLLSWIDKQEVIAFDIETTGLNVRQDKIIGFGVSNSETAFYIPHLEWCFEELKLIEINNSAICIQVLEALKSKKLVTFNGSFDSRFTYHFFGVNLIDSIHVDTMLLKHTVDEERPFGLKDIAKKVFGVSATEEQQEMKASIKANGGSTNEYYKADLEILAKYCQQDCKLTYRLMNHYLQELEAQDLEQFFFEDEVMPLYREVTIPMELKGIPVDVPALEKAEEEILADLDKLEMQIQKAIKPHLSAFTTWYLNKEYPPRRSGDFAQAIAEDMGWNLSRTATGKFSMTTSALKALPDSAEKEFLLGGAYLPDYRVRELQERLWLKDGQAFMFNLNSTHHLKKLFFEALQEKPLSTTPTGQPQANEYFIKSIENKYDWAPMLIEYHKLVKIHGTYITRFLREQENGIFYPSFNQHRTVTGRMGSDIQQMPRKIKGDSLYAKHNNKIRDFLISGKGYKFIGADYTSLEVVVFADDAQDEALLNMIRNKEDLYSSVAIEVLGLGDKYSANKEAENFLKNHEPEIRQDSKAYSLGIRYGLESFKLSKDLGIEQSEADKIIKSYFKKYPNLKERMDQLAREAKVLGRVKSKAGRVRHLKALKGIFYKERNTLFNEQGNLVDGLTLWKKFNESPRLYNDLKAKRKLCNRFLNSAFNFPIQSFASSIVNRASIALARELKNKNINGYICGNFHDELLVRSEELDSNKVKPIMQNCMENTTKLSVPLEAVPEIGDVYGEIK